jgi:hypothetical protein
MYVMQLALAVPDVESLDRTFTKQMQSFINEKYTIPATFQNDSKLHKVRRLGAPQCLIVGKISDVSETWDLPAALVATAGYTS